MKPWITACNSARSLDRGGALYALHPPLQPPSMEFW